MDKIDKSRDIEEGMKAWERLLNWAMDDEPLVDERCGEEVE